MNTLRLDHRRTAPVMPFWTCFSFCKEFLLQLQNKVCILAMRGGDYA